MKEKWKRTLMTAAAVAALGAFGAAQAQEISMRVVGNFSGNKKHVDGVERPFFKMLDQREDMQISYNTMDALGIEAADALRLISSGAFDVMSVQIGMASRDDPFFEGVDLAGVAQDLDEQRKVVDAIREEMDQRLQERFNAKLMTLWPFGPQMIFCNAEVDDVSDLEGLKIRVFTPSMSRLVEALGGTPVTLQFSEVYLALQRGVADCGITAPTAGNSGKWPEVATHFIPLPLSFSVQGHFMNLDTWNRLPPEQQKELTEAFKEMEQDMWEIARTANGDAIACTTGQDSCSDHTKYDLELVELDEGFRQRIHELTEQVVLPVWGQSCNAVYPQCTEVWNENVGEVTGYQIELNQ